MRKLPAKEKNIINKF